VKVAIYRVKVGFRRVEIAFRTVSPLDARHCFLHKFENSLACGAGVSIKPRVERFERATLGRAGH
jgi:2-keto-3-deoxy-6-phosphogluconate aldolase